MLFAHLLPIRSYRIEWRFTQSLTLPFFHQAVLTGYVRTLLKYAQQQKDQEQRDQAFYHLAMHCPETGKTHYQAGEHYAFYVYQFGDNLEQIQLLFDILDALAPIAKAARCAGAFGDNMELLCIRDGLSEQLIAAPEDACVVDEASLEAQITALKSHSFNQVSLRFISPLRAKTLSQDKNLKGKRRPLCQHSSDISAELLFDRLFDAAAMLDQQLSDSSQKATRPPHPDASLGDCDLFWVDCAYSNASNSAAFKEISGLMGSLTLNLPELNDLQWQILILGQYIGLGENRRFGCGRYQLLTANQQCLIPHPKRAKPLIDEVIHLSALEQSWHTEQAKQPQGARLLDSSDLNTLAQQCQQLDYWPQPLYPKLLEEPGKKPRLLLLPDFADKLVQKTLSRWLSQSLDHLYSENSFGYRQGHSRLGAKDQISMLIRKGYGYALDADIADFFHSVSRQRLLNRLTCLYGDDPIWPLMERILYCPLEQDALPAGYEDFQAQGLNLGSSISPVLANLMLDHLDSVLANHDYKMVRFADDFLVLCKKQSAAQQAKQLISQLLADHDLQLNPEKTHIRSFRNGIRFLGYFFLNDTVVAANGPEYRDSAPFPAPLALPTASQSALFYQQAQQKTLCLCGDIAHISLDQQRLVIERDDQPLTNIPLHHLDNIMLFGPHQITTQALTAAMQHKITVHFASGFGRYQGGASALADNPAFHLQQAAHFSQTQHALHFASSLVNARIRSQKEVLRQRHANAPSLDHCLTRLKNLHSIDQCLGIEGNAARAYWAAFQGLCAEQWDFKKRIKRQAPDPINSLLSYGYSLLYSHMDSLLRSEGFFPTLGGYHQTRGTHSALASDMMEPFRYLIERAVLTVIHTGQLKSNQFYHHQGQCWLDKAARKFWSRYLIAQLQKPQFSASDGHKNSALDQMLQQARNLKQWIQGDTPHFAPWQPR